MFIPGLSEKRPSVLTGDRILVRKHGDINGKWYEGRVHLVHERDLGMKFHKLFNKIPLDLNSRFMVRFKLNRHPFRCQHQALDVTSISDRFLFPPKSFVQGLQAPSAGELGLNFFNHLLDTDPAQQQAVASIISLPIKTTPFVLFGPPGTGKTVTVVEAIRQILNRDPTARILACAPSNSAADIIALRLAPHLNHDEMFRFYAPSRLQLQTPVALQDYTLHNGQRFSVPPVDQLKNFRLIVSTCVSASMPHGVGIDQGHFSHIFVDEAGQATETEAMIPIRTMANDNTRVIVSGDPKQLGPIIRSPTAKELGLEKSYLERLMEFPAYDEVQQHGISIVKLIRNFRSHPAILRFPNERFYGNDLIPAGDTEIINAYIGCDILPARKFPIIFHAISGRDEREEKSPSFFNIAEATQVRWYVEALQANQQVQTSNDEIGIISPYRAQCGKIRLVLRDIGDGIKVGSVEEFQGQERKVIIISTVRSNKEQIQSDLRYTLGFLSSPRRFNVAVTRAKALLIVVGDPNILSFDPLWRSFLNYVHTNGGWVGDVPEWDTNAEVDMNEFTG